MNGGVLDDAMSVYKVLRVCVCCGEVVKGCTDVSWYCT